MAKFGYSALAVLFASVLWVVMGSRADGALSRVLQSRFMVSAGKYSYALYLMHVPIASVVFPQVIDRLSVRFPTIEYELAFCMAFAAAFCISWLAAWASWHVLERRILSLKRYFEYGR